MPHKDRAAMCTPADWFMQYIFFCLAIVHLHCFIMVFLFQTELSWCVSEGRGFGIWLFYGMLGFMGVKHFYPRPQTSLSYFESKLKPLLHVNTHTFSYTCQHLRRERQRRDTTHGSDLSHLTGYLNIPESSSVFTLSPA